MESQSNFSLNWSGNVKANPEILYPKNLEELKKITNEKNFIIAGNQRSFGDNSVNSKLIVSMNNCSEIFIIYIYNSNIFLISNQYFNL